MIKRTSSRTLGWPVGLILATGVSSCAQPARAGYDFHERQREAYFAPDLVTGQVISQGMLGISFFDEVERSGGTNPAIDPGSDDLEHMPFIGGAWQEVYGGDRIDWGLEAGGFLGFRTGNAVVDSSAGGGAVQVDVDLFLFDIFGGIFVSTPIGDRVRVYAGTGPVLQVATYSQEGHDAVSMEDIDQDGTGLGLGLYARTGIEFIAENGVVLGLGVRWVDSRVSLDDGLGRLDLQGLQAVLTFSKGY